MLLRLVLVVAVLVAATGLGVWWRARQGRFVAAAGASEGAGGAGRLTAGEIGAALGERATFVQFSSAVCAPCRRVRDVLAQLAAQAPGVVHVELDVEQHLGLVRRVNVLRTPTVLLLDGAGTVVGRVSGEATRAQMLAVLESCPEAAPGR